MKYISSLLMIFLVGCVSSNIDSVVDHYNMNINKITLGMDIDEFNSIFGVQQAALMKGSDKPPTRFTRQGEIFDVVYLRTARIPDGETTDDEFTPHVFKSGKLYQIGWEALGGAKRTSNDVAREQSEIEKAKASATKIEQTIEQKTTQ